MVVGPGPSKILIFTKNIGIFYKLKKKSSYETLIVTLWFWLVKHRWSFTNNLYIKKKIMNNFAIKIIIDEVY